MQHATNTYTLVFLSKLVYKGFNSIATHVRHVGFQWRVHHVGMHSPTRHSSIAKQKKIVQSPTHRLKQPQSRVGVGIWTIWHVSWTCREKGNTFETLLLFLCTPKYQILTSHVIERRIVVVVLTNYMVDLATPIPWFVELDTRCNSLEVHDACKWTNTIEQYCLKQYCWDRGGGGGVLN